MLPGNYKLLQMTIEYKKQCLSELENWLVSLFKNLQGRSCLFLLRFYDNLVGSDLISLSIRFSFKVSAGFLFCAETRRIMSWKTAVNNELKISSKRV